MKPSKMSVKKWIFLHSYENHNATTCFHFGLSGGVASGISIDVLQRNTPHHQSHHVVFTLKCPLHPYASSTAIVRADDSYDDEETSSVVTNCETAVHIANTARRFVTQSSSQ